MAKYVFATIGGCASKYLINRLSEKYVVGNKPDAVFQPILKPLNINPGTFEERSKGFLTKNSDSLEEIFPKYIQYIRRKPNMTAVFNFAAEKSLFSKFKIEDVIFQVRHPLHSYLSFAKPNRHGSKIDYMGGINSKSAINYYCNRWNSLVDEYCKLINLGISTYLLRFEFMDKDINKLPDLKWVYRHFDSSKRNKFILSEKSEDYLKKLVAPYYLKIYEEWNV